MGSEAHLVPQLEGQETLDGPRLHLAAVPEEDTLPQIQRHQLGLPAHGVQPQIEANPFHQQVLTSANEIFRADQPQPVDQAVACIPEGGQAIAMGGIDTEGLPQQFQLAPNPRVFERRGDRGHRGVRRQAAALTEADQRRGQVEIVTPLRTLVDPNKPEDVEQVHALQDAVKVEQPGGPGAFDIPKWDPVSQTRVREALLALAAGLPDTRRSFGTKAEVDPVRRLISSASAWRGNPDRDALYLNATPAKNDGTTVHRLHVTDVPVDGFWSISVYNAKGFFEANPLNAYSINNVTAKKNDDGSVDVQFGGCDGQVSNCLPINAGWNYMVRLYRPKQAVLDGTWTFPEAQPVQ